MCSQSHVTFYEQFDCFHYSAFSLARRSLESLWWAHVQPAGMKPTGQPWNWAATLNKTMWQLSESILNSKLNELHNLINSKGTSLIDKSIRLTDSQIAQRHYGSIYRPHLQYSSWDFSGVGCVRRGSGSPCWPRTCYALKDDLEFTILLPSPLKCWDNRCVLPWMGYDAGYGT